MLVLKGLIGLHRTLQLQLLQRYRLGHRLGSPWNWMVCLPNEERSPCPFWDCIQVLLRTLLLTMMAIPFHVILRLVLKWLLQNVFPQPSMSMLSAPHPHQSLKLIFLKLWNFHICPFVACEMASHGSFSCIYLFTNKFEHLFMLLAIPVSSSLKQVFMYFPHFSIELPVFLIDL